jgi:hypothetical protein
MKTFKKCRLNLIHSCNKLDQISFRIEANSYHLRFILKFVLNFVDNTLK